MDKINGIKNENFVKCKNILEKIDNAELNDLTDVENILSKDNTNPLYIQTYLVLLKKLKSEDFLKNEIKKYEYFVTQEFINKEFYKIYIKKSCSKKLFDDLWKKIISYEDGFSFEQNLTFYRNLISILPDFDERDIKGFTGYTINKELSIFILAQKIIKGIIRNIEKINDYKVDKNNYSIKFNLDMIQEVDTVRKVQKLEEQNLIGKSTQEERELSYFYMIIYLKNLIS